MTETERPAEGTDIEELEHQTPSARIYAPNHVGPVVGVARDVITDLTIVRKVMGLRDAHELGPIYVKRALKSYVARSFTSGPRRFDLEGVAELLRVNHHVTLIGEPGTGRRTAAVALLGLLAVRLEEIPGWDPGQPGQFTVSELPAHPGTGYLFVHPDNEIASPELGDELRAYQEKLAGIGSFLVFVATAAAWHAAGGTSRETVLIVGSPDRRALLEARVRAGEPSRSPTPLLAVPRIVALAERGSPRDVVRLADLIVQVADDPRWDAEAESHLDQQVTEIVSGYQEWTDVITSWLRQHQSVDERLFLLAAAVLEGSSAGLILRQAEELRRYVGDDRSEPHGINGPGVRELAAAIEADWTPPKGPLSFRHPGYGPAVLDYLLSDRSDSFGDRVRDWMIMAPRTNRPGETTHVASLVADAALGVVRRRGDIGFAIPIANAWAGSRALRPALVYLLTAAALSKEAGAATRARLNLWAAYSRSQSVCEVVADVCTGDLADTYRQVVLTRVNNLAVRARGPLVPVVVDAVVKLWGRRPMRRDILRYLLKWLGDRDEPAFAVGSATIAALGSETIRLAYESGLDRGLELSRAVANLLRSPLEPEHLRDTLFGWFDLAVDDEAFAEWLLGVIAAAIPGPDSGQRVTCVRIFAYGWDSAAGDGGRSRLRERLVDMASNADTTFRSWSAVAERKEYEDEQRS